MIQFTNPGPPLVSADLDEIENRFGFKFPGSFRSHYLKYNGGHPNPNRFVDNKGTCIIHDFLPLKRSNIKGLSTLEADLQYTKIDRDILPRHLIQFAVDPFGNYYCFSIRREDFGAIYWIKMEGEQKSDGDFLSPSLDDFLGRLKAKAEIQKAK